MSRKIMKTAKVVFYPISEVLQAVGYFHQASGLSEKESATRNAKFVQLVVKNSYSQIIPIEHVEGIELFDGHARKINLTEEIKKLRTALVMALAYCECDDGKQGPLAGSAMTKKMWDRLHELAVENVDLG